MLNCVENNALVLYYMSVLVSFKNTFYIKKNNELEMSIIMQGWK